MDHLVLAAVEEIALEGPTGCTFQQLWKLLEGNLPPEVRTLSVGVKRQLSKQLCTRSDIEFVDANASRSDEPTHKITLPPDSQVLMDACEAEQDSGLRLVASAQARDMALGIYDQHILHPLNDEMRRTLALTGKSRKKGAVQSELARICNVPHKNFFIIVKTLETHSLVVRNNIQIRGETGHVQTSILHLIRFAPDLAPGLKFAKTSAGDKSLYAVTDDEATVAILLKRMREMDPSGNGIVRSEFKRFVLRTMHAGNIRQNHRLWRRLQTKMVKQGVLDLSVTEVHGKMRTIITALQPEKVQQEQEEEHVAGTAFPLMAERSFAREFYHLVLNAGEEGIVMNELGKHLQFPTRTFHKPNYLQDFLQRLGLIYTKEQKGKAVVVCVRAPGPLLATHRQNNPPEGLWLQQGWLHAVHDAIDAGPTSADLDPGADIAAPGAILLPAEPVAATMTQAAVNTNTTQPSLLSHSTTAGPAGTAGLAALPMSETQSYARPQAVQTSQQLSARPQRQLAQVDIDLPLQQAVPQMPLIPAPSSTTPAAQDEENVEPGLTQETREAVEAKLQSLPCMQGSSSLSYDRVIRMMLELEKTGYLFRSAMRRFFRETDPPEITGGGPDTKTIDRYFTQMCDFNQLQKLSIPVSLTTSMAAHDVIAYVKPDVEVSDALISQLVEKWRAMSTRMRSEGVRGYHRDLKDKSYKEEQEVLPKPHPVRPSKLNANIIKQGPDMLNKLYDNGYIRSKMIRIRLLHYWICKLLGLGGYERLAANGSQSRPSQHVFTFKAAMPSDDHFQSTAQLTNGIESWESPLALDAKQLQNMMSVEVFLQTVGTSRDVPNRLELTASGRCMGDLSEEERSKLVDTRGDSRTSQHMEMLRCLGLIESIVVAPPDGKAAFSVAPTVASRYVALTTGIIEVQRDKTRSTVQPSSMADGKEQFEECSFDFTSREGLGSYWAQLAQMSVDYSKPNHGEAMKAWQRPTWFPATTVPDILSRRAWNTLHVMTLGQSEKLKHAFEKAADEHGYVSWVACMHIAKQLGLEYEQVNALSNMRKAKLGRLEPVTKQPRDVRQRHLVGRTLSDLPAEFVAKHEASIAANTAKRFAKQGIQAANIARLVEEHMQKNRRVRARAERKKRGLPPHRLRRKPSEIPAQELRSFTDRKERRLRDKASRLDDGELGPGFMPKRAPKRRRAGTPASAAVSDVDGAYPVRQFRGPKGPAHSFSNHEDKAILRAFARWRTHRSPEYFVNFRRFKLPVTLELAKRRFYKAFPRYQQTQKLVQELQELCVDVYQRHHARKVERWQASQLNPENALHSQPVAAVATAASEGAQQPAPEDASALSQPQAAGQAQGSQQQPQSCEPQQASTAGQPAKAGQYAKAGQPVKGKSAEDVVKAKAYLTEAKLAKLMHRSVTNRTSIPLLPQTSDSKDHDAPTSPAALHRHDAAPLSPQSPVGLSPIGDGNAAGTPSAMPPPSTPATLTPLPPGQLPAKSPPGGRPLLDPFEPIFACEDEEDEASLRTIEDIIGLILDVTPRRPARPSQEPRKRRLFEAEGGEARKRRHIHIRAEEDDDPALLGGEAAASMLQGRSAARSWKKMLPLPARGPLQLPGAKKPNVIEAHAMELIKSLLYQGLAEGDIVAALSQRFTVPEMTAALAFLQQQGLVNASGVKRPLLLSKLFAEQIEVLDFPEQLCTEASAARQQLQQILQPGHHATQASLSKITLNMGESISSGMVCEIMALLAADCLQLGLGAMQLPNADEDTEDSSQTSASYPLVITACQGSSRACQSADVAHHNNGVEQQPSPGHRHRYLESQHMLDSNAAAGTASQHLSGTDLLAHANGKRKAESGGDQNQDPMLSDSVGRRPKLTACGGSRAEHVGAAVCDTVMRHTEGSTGLSKAQLADKLSQGKKDCTNLDGAVQACLDAGRLQWAPAFDEQLLVPVSMLDRLKAGYRAVIADESQPPQDFHSLAGLQAAKARSQQQDSTGGLHEPAAKASDEASCGAQQHSAAQDSAALDAAGTAGSDRDRHANSIQQKPSLVHASVDQPDDKAQSDDTGRHLVNEQLREQQQQGNDCSVQAHADSACETLLKPWHDHTGGLNETYWAALTRRVMSVVMRNPGIPEGLLVSQMQILSPQQAKSLLDLMTTQGQLKVQATYESSSAALPAIFGLTASSETQAVLHYFVAQGASFGSLSQLSPRL